VKEEKQMENMSLKTPRLWSIEAVRLKGEMEQGENTKMNKLNAQAPSEETKRKTEGCGFRERGLGKMSSRREIALLRVVFVKLRIK
jgi:hypothetical protein